VPSIVNGLFAGRAGISTHGTAIGVIGDNISNANTIGFKASRTDFSDLLAGGQQPGRVVGIGSKISNIVADQEQGTLEFTGRTLDMAVDGKGFFIVADGAQRLYTRAGNFKVDASGFVVTANNNAVLGFPEGGTGALSPINIKQTPEQAGIETTSVAIAGNLDASSSFPTNFPANIPNVGLVGGTAATGAASVSAGANPAGPEPYSFADLANNSQFTTVIEVFDTLGASHDVSLYFFNKGGGNWEVQAYAPSEDVAPDSQTGAITNQPRYLGGDVITFGTDGRRNPAPAGADFFLDSIIAGTGPDWGNNSDINIPIGISLDPFTQYSANSAILSLTQDGLGVGSVVGVNIEKDGRVFALLDNGTSTIIGQLAFATFINEEGLVRYGSNLLQRSLESGEAIIGTPKSGTFGSLKSSTIELSNTDLASEFVKLISLQRGFQANSRIISSINQLLGEIVQLV
jgi:flagellar hook protein FlgE